MKIKDADTIQIMKDYMANGRFSRGREVTGYASFSFVGNFDLNIPRIVNSYDHDLLVTLPEAFDLAVIDRIYNYIPGWEIPKIDDSAYNNNFGLITDYLSEALHYLFVHDSDYVGIVNARLKKGIISKAVITEHCRKLFQDLSSFCILPVNRQMKNLMRLLNMLLKEEDELKNS